jgi:hypothetical protein
VKAVIIKPNPMMGKELKEKCHRPQRDDSRRSAACRGERS